MAGKEAVKKIVHDLAEILGESVVAHPEVIEELLKQVNCCWFGTWLQTHMWLHGIGREPMSDMLRGVRGRHLAAAASDVGCCYDGEPLTHVAGKEAVKKLAHDLPEILGDGAVAHPEEIKEPLKQVSCCWFMTWLQTLM
ncbi:hypothetical protein Scep_021765 [Stephania cephalantha]|uniref:Uncharacterized protein n=1 Tax=Stephania cephalantha TaxID=152367 RepID=A0AAP0F563_9MAGN